MMYLAGQTNYLQRIQKIADFLKYSDITDPPSGNDGLTVINGPAYDWSFGGDDASNVQHEDISHGAFEANFARLCYEYNIPGTFNQQDMNLFAGTFRYNIYKNPAEFNVSVNGQNPVNVNLFTYPFDANTGVSVYAIGRWLAFSRWKPDIFQIVSYVYEDITLFNSPPPVTQKQLGLANLALYKHLLEPLGNASGFGPNSDWAGVAGGDFDGNGEMEFVAARNYPLGSNIYMLHLIF